MTAGDLKKGAGGKAGKRGAGLGFRLGIKGLALMRRPIRVQGTGTRLHPPTFGGMP